MKRELEYSKEKSEIHLAKVCDPYRMTSVQMTLYG